MINLKKSKKAFTINFLVLLICFVTFCIVGFIFYLLFGFLGKMVVYDIGSDVANIDAEYQLLSYLRAPIEVNAKTINMADLIVNAANGISTKEELKEKSKELLSFCDDQTCCSITVIKNDKEILNIEPVVFIEELCYNKRIEAAATIPSKNPDEPYTVKLTFYIYDKDMLGI